MPRRIRALAFPLVALLGCANHVRFSDEVREREVRDVTRAAARIETPAPVLAEPVVELVVSADELVQVRRRETLVRLDEETPWRGRDELWEVPAGLVAVPLFVAVRASDKLFLGLIPDDVIEDGTDFGFAALNPALNVESTERLRPREVSRRTHELESSEERAIRPLADVALSVSLGGGPSQRVATGGDGRARIELLALLDGVPAHAPRALHVEVPGEGARPPRSVDLPLARQLSSRLMRAARLRASARAPEVAPDAAAQALLQLDALGFSESALALEHELRGREHANGAWLSRLDLALDD